MKFDINKECKITLKDFNFNEKVFEIIACDISRGNHTSKESHDIFKTIKDNLLKVVINRQHVSSVISLDDKYRGVGKSKFLQSLKFLLEELEHSKVVLVSSHGLENQEYIKAKDIAVDIQRGKQLDVILVDDITEEELELIQKKYPETRTYGFIKEAKETLYEKTVRKLKENCKEHEYKIAKNEILFFTSSAIHQASIDWDSMIALTTSAVRFQDYKNYDINVHLVDFQYSCKHNLDGYYPKEKVLACQLNGTTLVLKFDFEYTPILTSEQK